MVGSACLAALVMDIMGSASKTWISRSRKLPFVIGPDYQETTLLFHGFLRGEGGLQRNF